MAATAHLRLIHSAQCGDPVTSTPVVQIYYYTAQMSVNVGGYQSG
jgi:hypothetical protein